MIYRHIVALALFASALFAGTDVRAQLVTNGSFQANNSFAQGWTSNGASFSTFGGQGGSSDNYVAFGSGDTLQQSVTLTLSSSKYLLTYYVNRTAGTAASIAFALINSANTTVFSGTANASSGWNAASFTSPQALASGTYTLRFSASGTNSGQNGQTPWAVGLDTISMVAAPGPVPGAGLLSLFAGLLAIGFHRVRVSRAGGR